MMTRANMVTKIIAAVVIVSLYTICLVYGGSVILDLRKDMYEALVFDTCAFRSTTATYVRYFAYMGCVAGAMLVSTGAAFVALWKISVDDK